MVLRRGRKWAAAFACAAGVASAEACSKNDQTVVSTFDTSITVCPPPGDDTVSVWYGVVYAISHNNKALQGNIIPHLRDSIDPTVFDVINPDLRRIAQELQQAAEGKVHPGGIYERPHADKAKEFSKQLRQALEGDRISPVADTVFLSAPDTFFQHAPIALSGIKYGQVIPAGKLTCTPGISGPEIIRVPSPE